MLIMKNRVIYEKSSNSLLRKSGMFYRRRISLAGVCEIFSINRDAITHDEVMICFLLENGVKFFISEFDDGFAECVEILAEQFPGIQLWDSNLPQNAFTHASKILWKPDSYP